MSTVFVTGGSGFIGRVLLRRLVAEGHVVRALVRSETSARAVAGLGAEPVYGDVTEPADWQEHVRGSAAVFHLAAETDISADRARQEQVTVQGTRSALDSARLTGVPRFVHCGSEAALLGGDPLVEVDESAPLRPDSEAVYCAVKADAEKIVLEASSQGFDTVSIRPRFVWGPGSVVTDGLVEAARAGQFAWIDGSRQITDITFVDNAVEGLVRGWHHGHPGRAYFVTDQHRVVFRDFMEQVFAVFGLDPERVPDLDAATAALQVPVPLRWFLGQTCTLRTENAVADLGYAPVTSRSAAFDVLRDHVRAGTA